MTLTYRTLKIAGVFVALQQERLLNHRLSLIAREMLLSHSHLQRAKIARIKVTTQVIAALTSKTAIRLFLLYLVHTFIMQQTELCCTPGIECYRISYMIRSCPTREVIKEPLRLPL